MLCRRCGMESSTTDVCEWCKRPMLPEGSAVTGQRAPEGAAAEQAASAAEAPKEAEKEVRPLAEGPAAAGAAPAKEAAAEGQVLRPLGGGPAEGPPRPRQLTPQPGMPSHGVSEEATKTSIDVSQYAGGDESLFRPIERPERAEILGGADPLARRRRRDQAMGPTSEISDNVRLLRSTIAGVIISLVLALIQFIVSVTVEGAKEVPGSLIFASVTLIRNLGRSGTLLSAVMYGTLIGAMMGVGLGAVLVRFKRGPFIGMIVGLIVGYGLLNAPWGLILGGLTGIACGVIATVGLRQVVAV